MRKMILLLTLLLIPAVRSIAEPTDAHNYLKKAAWFAVSSGNTELLEALLKAGLQVDEPIDFEQEDDNTAPFWTMLHYSVVHNQPRIARVLVGNGANLDIRDTFHKRPIDMAYDNEQFQMCGILARGNEKENELCGCPLSVWDE